MSSDRRGFTLAEILVSLVVLEVGLMGAAGMLLVADRTLNRARDTEWALQEARTIADSLSSAGATAGGESVVEVGVIRWEVSTGGALAQVRITADLNDGRRVVDVSLVAPTGEDPRDA